MRVKRIGYLNEDHKFSGRTTRDIGGILANLSFGDDSETFEFPIIIDAGPSARTISLSVPIGTALLRAQESEPVAINNGGSFTSVEDRYIGLFLYKNQVFEATLDCVTSTSEEKAKLLVKKLVLSEDNELARLRREVLAMERLSTSHSSAKRTAIPETIKMIVFQRDQGKCVRCGAKENLHFDHIIPVSKGGSNSEENVQLLCETCNLKKSDKIMF
jgi:hypothetical protein